ncbi:GntR family transcriptional regulator [Nocardia sp. NBC_00565]|uniref:GntR family transcriptional regulator n=1 Tax=Nocardia sp. NBC_00565 TaxID=2975993 RepID=UPI002E8163D9|nr:GntR family transcriptional regulator [Nocardia sp. NBC_00565]WUC07923.1 GntR family transcriptional regulator [Nocardia sp. NBC_00565]
MTANFADDFASDTPGGAVVRAATDIRELILQRVLLPGEQVRQEDLASRLGISRGPIREALQVLAVEGVVRYERNRGYFVTRFTAEEMRQLYLIRDLLESEVLRSLPPMSAKNLNSLRKINKKIQEDNNSSSIIRLNRTFHDTLTEHSPLSLLKSELAHIGRMTTAYQSLSINSLANRHLVVSDHEEMITALAANDNDLLVIISRRHREASLDRLTPILG